MRPLAFSVPAHVAARNRVGAGEPANVSLLAGNTFDAAQRTRARPLICRNPDVVFWLRFALSRVSVSGKNRREYEIFAAGDYVIPVSEEG
jgi:hypothetical protein